jgi:L-fuconolactonase
MMPVRIDAHHLFSETNPPATLWPILERNRFKGSILIQPRKSAEATKAALLQAGACAFIEAVSAWAELSGAELDQLQTHPKFRGVCANMSADLDLREPARRGLALDICLTVSQFEDVEAVASRAPAALLIVEGMGRPEISKQGFEEWAPRIEKLGRITTVSLKLSSLTLLARPGPWNSADLKPFVEHAIICFGPERLLFGSAWPELPEAGTWKESLAAFTQSIGAHSIDFREKLLGSTAARLYKVNP